MAGRLQKTTHNSLLIQQNHTCRAPLLNNWRQNLDPRKFFIGYSSKCHNSILKDTLLYIGLDYPQNVTRLLPWVSSKQVVPSQGVETKVM